MYNWQNELTNNITTAGELQPIVGMSDRETEVLDGILQQYPMAITPYYMSLVALNDPNDPIKKMCIPSALEMELGGSEDTSGEATNTVAEGLQHKYRQTALILTTNRCAMYCRHCFRKRLVGLSDDEIADGFDDVLKYITDHPEIDNAILSGGDVLMLDNRLIRDYLENLTALPQLNIIRLATRMPVVLPKRISEDEELLAMLEEFGAKKQLYVVTQFNHPREITEESVRAIKALTGRGIVVKNQTVLLGGINDDPEVLSTLLSRLVAVGVVPYYIFQCRPVKGVKSQFQIPIARGVVIVEQAKSMVNGQAKCVKYCMSHPRGKIEIIGQAPFGEMIFKFHQAKYPRDHGRIFTTHVGASGWLTDELQPDDSL
jgi:KamA family protein